MAFSDTGCTVDVVCPGTHPVAKTKAVRHLHEYRALAPLPSFLEAILAAKPDLVIPTDDLSTRHLHELYLIHTRSGGHQVCALIERSLGAGANFTTLSARTKIIHIARNEGIRVPDATVISNIQELRKWGTKNGFPIVLKADGSSGGEGVRIVNTFEEAERAFGILKSPPSLARTAKYNRPRLDIGPAFPPPASLCRKCAIVYSRA